MTDAKENTAITTKRPPCPHGVPYGGIPGPAIAMNAPYTTCECCLAIQFYIDSASYSSKGSSGRSWTKGLCSACGGHYVDSGTW